ncbi:DUF389 domain-containing protein [Neolewinella aurantiaca]|uniref:DUF389 domain-containing protein n=1 Tax=Neolewinella aurantiaca TaxID=2602767 RepID=A0A5C7FGV4_9BACT|nr:DUF389 domain-containing protein [Neolewinella aurantiaca]TXF88945.1 DUF389 domain-containing protein [Neolewinella aurantiaca]
MLSEADKTGSTEVTPGQSISKWFKDFMDLREGSDRAGATESISNGKLMRGSNAWMLVCSIMIASLGLNLNSGAVIIGAMLISPLMNPILGVGLAIATNDREMLWQSLKNFGIAIAIALITSIVYFALTPIDIFTEEMQARTEPTILDALVAVFGGLAGIISVTRLDKTNAIPGVAIATALMPPLCVAGYGIVLAFSDPAQGLSVFWRAGYLFFLNSFFIAVMAYLIIRLLRFPYRKYVNAEDKRRSKVIIGLISVLMILPGAYVLKGVIADLRMDRSAREFTLKYFPSSKSTYLFNRETPEQPLLIFPLKDRLLDRDSLEYYSNLLRNPPYNLQGARIVTDTSFTASQMAGIQSKLNTMDNQSTRLNAVEQRLGFVIARQEQLREEVSNKLSDSLRYQELTTRLKLAFPSVESVFVAERGQRDSTATIPLVALRRSLSGRRPPASVAAAERERMDKYLRSELAADSIVLVIEDL